MSRVGPVQPRARSLRGRVSQALARARLSPRWFLPGVIALGACGLILIGLLVVYPRVGASMIRDKLGGKVAGRLGREVSIGSIHVSLGHAVLRDVEVRGRTDRTTPLVH